MTTAIGQALPQGRAALTLRGRYDAMARAARRRSLAGDQRAGSWARAEARVTQQAFLRRNWIPLLAAGLVMAAFIAVTAALTPDPFVRGMIVGGGLVGVASMTWSWTLQATGTAPRMMGDLGEQWTAQELRKLRRRGWLLVNHVTLTTPDADHVLIGPGGVIAIESKWSAQDWEPGGMRLRTAASQARNNARRLSLWQDLKALGVGPVSSVVILWGPGARDLAGPFDLDGTTIVPGQHAPAWRAGLPEGQLTAQQVDAAWQVLDAHCRTTDPHEARTHPTPLSIWQWAARAVLSVVAACTGFLAVSSVVTAGPPWGVSLAWWALLLAAGVGAARVPAARYLGLAWAAGVSATAVLVIIVLAKWAL